MKEQIAKLSKSYASTKKELNSSYNSYAAIANNYQIQKNTLNGLKTFLRVMKWLENPRKQCSSLNETKDLICLFREQSLLPFVSGVSQNIRDSILVKPEIERIYNKTFLELENRNKDIEMLQADLNELKSVLTLKNKIYSTLGLKINKI